jgi:hypothetical protein
MHRDASLALLGPARARAAAATLFTALVVFVGNAVPILVLLVGTEGEYYWPYDKATIAEDEPYVPFSDDVSPSLG